MATTYQSKTLADKVTAALQRILQEGEFEDGDGGVCEDLIAIGGGVRTAETFEEAMMLTSDAGVDIRFRDGSVAQIIVRAGTPTPDE